MGLIFCVLPTRAVRTAAAQKEDVSAEAAMAARRAALSLGADLYDEEEDIEAYGQ